MAETDRSIRQLKGVGEKRAALFCKLGIDSVDALLRHYPRDYKDWSHPCPVFSDNLERVCCVRVKLLTPVRAHYIRQGMTLYRFTAADASGPVTVTFFNTRFLATRLHAGETYLLCGKMIGGPTRRELASPEIQPADFTGMQPVYRTTAGLSSRQIEATVRAALPHLPDDPLPDRLREEEGLCTLREALFNIHFPPDEAALSRARKRLIFEELFLLQAGLLCLRQKTEARTAAVFSEDFTAEFAAALPFALTGAQRRAIGECMADLRRPRPMNRLLQGDVGSGKTAVAAALCYSCAKNGFQAAVMAPTELLAEQHYATFSKLLSGAGVRVALLTGSTPPAQKRKIKTALADGSLDLVIGTHALIVETVTFDRLGLVVTDEQHRFGVAQRAALAAKGNNPHRLVMSATPIPRTLALMIYGELDVSVIDEYPKGRQKIQSYAVSTALRERVYGFIKRHLDAGRQGYIICPLVEEGETDTGLVPAETYYQNIAAGAFANYRVGLLHGKLPPREKDRVMRAFAAGEIQLLVATTVIEVGIDVPNAAILVVENAERFGLSQLHQLRGRIGRGQWASSCVFLSDARNEDAVYRLRTLCKTQDGFEIAQADLKLRGPGDFLGRRQHGLPELKIADLTTDLDLMQRAGARAKALLRADPTLQKPEHAALAREIERMFSENFST